MNSVFINLTGNEDRHKTSDEFKFRSYLTSHFGVTCHWAVKKKWCLQLFSVTFDWIFVKLTCNEDRHKIPDEFEIGPGHYGVICPWAFPLTLNWENGVSIFSQLLWIQSSSNLQEMRTGIKPRTSSNFGRIWAVILELHALERWKKCLQLFSVTFDWIFVKLAGNKDRHKSSNEFEFGPDRIIHFGVIRPWAQIFFPIGL